MGDNGSHSQAMNKNKRENGASSRCRGKTHLLALHFLDENMLAKEETATYRDNRSTWPYGELPLEPTWRGGKQSTEEERQMEEDKRVRGRERGWCRSWGLRQ